MTKYIRVLSIRRHKTVTFLNVYGENFGNIQCMADNNLVESLNCGDLIKCEMIDTLNNKGCPIKKICSVDEIIKCAKFQSYKGVEGKVSDQELNTYLNARNCGSQLNILKYKRDLLNEIKVILDGLDYFDSTGLLNVVENYATGSNIQDAIIQNREMNQPRYLRTTMENQLKQITATLLKSSYAIEKVHRSMGEDATHINEFLMLELVSINETMDDMLKFIEKLDSLAKKLAVKNDVVVQDRRLDIIDYRTLDPTKYESIRKDFSNTLVYNFPCNSPFILEDVNGLRKETRWYIKGHLVGHYYKDEYRYQNVAEAIEKQNEISHKDDVNPMHYFEWGLPSSISFGMSIDRWLQLMLDVKNIENIANPICLDYKRRIR